MPDIKVYGIKNCDSMKKTFVWLDKNGIAYDFHDYKKSGADEAVLKAAIKAHGWENVINRKGTTWRGLSDADKARAASRDGAIGLMQQYPSLIKRPVVETGSSLLVGFDETRYTESFGA